MEAGGAIQDGFDNTEDGDEIPTGKATICSWIVAAARLKS